MRQATTWLPLLVVLACTTSALAGDASLNGTRLPALTLSSKAVDASKAPAPLPFDPARNLFHDPLTLSTDEANHDPVVPYVGIGLSGGLTSGDVNHQVLRQDIMGRSSSLSFSGLSTGLIPNEVQIGIRLPF